MEGTVRRSMENFGSLLAVTGKLRVKTEILTMKKLRFIRSLLLFIQSWMTKAYSLSV